MAGRITDKGRVKAGRGIGQGSEYDPWFKIGDFGSSGRSTRLYFEKTGRIHHFLSKLETRTFFWLSWQDGVTDIREQFPLDIKETKKIAKSLGYRHPRKNGVRVCYTLDFLVDTDQGQKAYQVRYSDAQNKRFAENNEVVQKLLERKNIPLIVISERSFSKALIKNLETINVYTEKPDTNLTIPYFVEQVASAMSATRTIRELIHEIAQQEAISFNLALHFFMNLVYEKTITLPIEQALLMDLSSDQIIIRD